MKNLSRAYNRHKKQVKFIKRVNEFFCHNQTENKRKCIKEALENKNFFFLKTTGRPCNCQMCTYKKYKRLPKHLIIKEETKK